MNIFQNMKSTEANNKLLWLSGLTWMDEARAFYFSETANIEHRMCFDDLLAGSELDRSFWEAINIVGLIKPTIESSSEYKT